MSPSDVKKDTEAASEFDMATEANMGVTPNMTTPEAATASAVEQQPTNPHVNDLLEVIATSASEAVSNEVIKSDEAPDTTKRVSIAGQVNITGKVNLTAQIDPSGRVTIIGKINLDGLTNLEGMAALNGQVKLSGEADITGQVVVSLPDMVARDAVVVAPIPRPQHADASLFQPANLLRRLTPELRKRIFDLVVADGVPGAPHPIRGEEQFIRTLKLPNITMVDRQTRDEVLGPLLHGKQFSVQLPRDEDKISRLESLQELVMNRHRGLGFDSKEILEDMKEHAKATEDEFHEYLAKTPDLDLCPFPYVGSLIVTYNGRVRLNEGFENWRGHPNERKQLNGDGGLDWRDFRGVRKAFVAALIKNEDWFSYVPYNDVLLHPMIQHLVKALCMFGSSQSKPLRWVEVIVFEFIDIPTGLGVEWSYLNYGEAVYQSEPDDGFGGFPDGRFMSGSEDSRESWEKESSAGEGDEDDENEDEKSSEDADNSEDGNSCEGQGNSGDDKSDGDHVDQEEVVKAEEEAREKPAGGDEMQADKESEGNHNSKFECEGA
ncbi:hypothetical protein INS49_014378 [Diaporthe citri]|uniref:uncharacterized protein n=1 Tax=Diaporthe citri TaxID=83186 RepID=UPI001C80238F|nr:uncharacterized protein INS49_014378 [Diaporthe citri]KAG6358494.1 hypothetical protein INS49_014378 [Diaporthe citri]